MRCRASSRRLKAPLLASWRDPFMRKSFTSHGQSSGITQANSYGFPQILAVTPLIQCIRTHIGQSGCSAYLCTHEMQRRCKRSWLKHSGQNMSQRCMPELCMYATLLFCQRRPLTAMRRDTSCACMPSSRLLIWAQQKVRHLYMLRHIQEFSFSSSQDLLGHINWTKQFILVQNEPLQIQKSGHCS